MSSVEVTSNNTVTQVIEVPLHLIKPSKTNPRKSFEADEYPLGISQMLARNLS